MPCAHSVSHVFSQHSSCTYTHTHTHTHTHSYTYTALQSLRFQPTALSFITLAACSINSLLLKDTIESGFRLLLPLCWFHCQEKHPIWQSSLHLKHFWLLTAALKICSNAHLNGIYMFLSFMWLLKVRVWVLLWLVFHWSCPGRDFKFDLKPNSYNSHYKVCSVQLNVTIRRIINV